MQFFYNFKTVSLSKNYVVMQFLQYNELFEDEKFEFKSF